jgi:hypothetical protein
MTADQRMWCQVPAWWFPVWVSLHGDAHTPDPLEEAVLGLIELGHGHPGDLALTLQVDASLIHSVLDALEGAGRIQQQSEQERWEPRPAAKPPEEPHEREGWIVWDPLARRPLLQVVFGLHPKDKPELPKGWQSISCDAEPELGKRPGDRSVDKALSFLPDVPELRGIERMGGGVRNFDSGMIRRIRRNPRERPERGNVYVPIEFRPTTDPVVWRPCVVPSARVSSEFDSAGWQGLLSRVDEVGRRELEARKLEVSALLTPFILQEAGYASMSALREAAGRMARHVLVGVWDNPSWELLQRMVVDAEVFATIAHAVKHTSLRQALHCWADVLEALSGMLHQRFEAAFTKERFREVLALPLATRKERVLARSANLGRSAQHLLKTVSKDDQLHQLRGVLARNATIGTRILGLAFARVFVPDVGRLADPALEECPAFFDELADANEIRVKVVHPGLDETEASEPVDLEDFRQRVLGIVRASMKIPTQ